MVTYLDLPASGFFSSHRTGGSKFAVGHENSLSGGEAALLRGAHILDFDARATSDAVQVAMHDADVARTTASSGAISGIAYASLPQLSAPETTGSGVPNEDIPTYDEIFDQFGGRAVIVIEPKLGTQAQVDALAALIHAHNLADSVVLAYNTDASIGWMVAAGVLAYRWGVTTTGGVTSAAAAGADFIDIPSNADATLMAAALAGGFHRVLSTPVGLRSEWAARNTGIEGFVIDSPDYVTRTTRRANNIADMISTGVRAPGTKLSGAIVDWLSPGVLKLQDGASQKQLMVGDVSGTPATAGYVTFKFKMPTLPTTTSQSVRGRALCPQEDTIGADTNTQGYVYQLRANGDIAMWSSNTTLGGAATALGTATAGADLVAGTEYTMLFEWTATQVRLTRVDTGGNTGWVNETTWRSPYHYAVTTMTTGVAHLTAFEVHDGRGDAAGSTAWSGTAAGSAPMGGTGTGTLTYVGTASGARTPKASATGDVAYVGAAAGTRTSTGTATGTLAWTGTAEGHRAAEGAATGALAYAGAAEGVRTPKATATGATAWVGTASGEAPVIDLATGAGTGLLTWVGVALGTNVEVVTPAERTLTLPAEVRVQPIGAEDRTHDVAAESRTYTVS